MDVDQQTSPSMASSGDPSLSDPHPPPVTPDSPHPSPVPDPSADARDTQQTQPAASDPEPQQPSEPNTQNEKSQSLLVTTADPIRNETDVINSSDARAGVTPAVALSTAPIALPSVLENTPESFPTDTVPVVAREAEAPESKPEPEGDAGVGVGVPQTPQVSLTFLLASGRRRTMSFEPQTTIARVKELVWNAWPTDWQEEHPPTPSYLRVLYLGKILQDDETLTSIGFSTHTPPPASSRTPPMSTIVHLAIRPYAPLTEDDAVKKKGRRRRRGTDGDDGAGADDGVIGGSSCCSSCVIC